MEKEITLKNRILYAILDIETTGGKFNKEGITEIAIYKYDGYEIIDQFSCLINPEIPIQPFVANLTGISDKMLRTAPKFYEIAKRVIEITDGCVIVAHNSENDYRIIKNEFKRLGYNYIRETIDTVFLSQKLIPNMPSYSLGKLCKSLGIPIVGRHRATGDAMATVKLFKILLNKDAEKQVIKKFVLTQGVNKNNFKLTKLLKDLPLATGVFYLHKENGDIIYMGEASNIRKKISYIFLSKTNVNKLIQKEVTYITSEQTGSRLIARLKENEELDVNRPIYNKKKVKDKFVFGISFFKDEYGYIQLKTCKNIDCSNIFINFISIEKSDKYLKDLILKYDLDRNEYMGSIKENLGGSSVEDYNKRAEDAILNNSFDNKSFMLIDKGRSVREKSVLLVEKGIFKGFAFVNLDTQFSNKKVLKSLIIPMKHTDFARNMIQKYMVENKLKHSSHFHIDYFRNI